MRIRPSVAHIHIYNGVAPVQWQYECGLRVVGQRAFGAEDALLCPRPLNARGCMVEVVVALPARQVRPEEEVRAILV